MSITSALIASTIDKIKKDLYQLEDWLNSLHGGSVPSLPSSANETNVSALLKRVEELTIEVHAQKHTIHHLVDRLDVMEETREIHIDGHLDDQIEDDPWLSGPTPLQNEIVDPTFFIHKTEEVEQPVPVVEATPIVEIKVVEAPSIVETKEAEAEEEQEEEEEQEAEEQVEEEAEQVEQEEQVESKDEVKTQEEEQQEVEDEEEGVELEEITVKGVNYYKDPEEGFIYEIDSDGQPSEQPVGVWKTKTQTISFYRST